MPHNATLRTLDNANRQAGVGANFHTQAAANTTVLNYRLVLVPLFEINSLFTEGANAHAGTTNAPVNPGVAGAAIYLGDTHVDFFSLDGQQCIGWANLGALAA